MAAATCFAELAALLQSTVVLAPRVLGSASTLRRLKVDQRGRLLDGGDGFRARQDLEVGRDLKRHAAA